ncbi:MAG: amidohydrolase family protein [Betaproteobacteria bacterium]|nr:amidohydrolase family protein [Betaproteobacteria bacterium]
MKGFSDLDVLRHRAEGLANCQYDRACLVMRETILGGVLHAHPSIRLVLSESGIGRIPYMLERMDLGWEDQFRPFLELDRKPSEYWFSQCHATYQTEMFGSRVIDAIGEDNVMWASDFPHPDGLWPDSMLAHRTTVQGRGSVGPQQGHRRECREALRARRRPPVCPPGGGAGFQLMQSVSQTPA